MNNIKAFFAILSWLLLFFSTTDARKDLGEYWRGVMKDQAMPESIQRLIPINPASTTVSKAKADCHASEDNLEQKMENFELKPDISIYDNGNKPTNQKFFMKEFEQRPDISIYDNGNKPTQKKFFVKDFELMPDLSIYDNDIDKPSKQRAFAKEFELMPDLSIYDNEVKPTEQKFFLKNFEPKPDISI